MSNDPKDTVVDLTKLLTGKVATNDRTVIRQEDTSSLLLTSCNESVNLIGHEIFTYNGDDKKNDK